VVDSGETVEVTVLNSSLTCDDTGGVVIVEGTTGTTGKEKIV
jgi:hypothetical protein